MPISFVNNFFVCLALLFVPDTFPVLKVFPPLGTTSKIALLLMRHCYLLNLAEGLGIEPRITESKSVVIPFNYPPTIIVGAKLFTAQP